MLTNHEYEQRDNANHNKLKVYLFFSEIQEYVLHQTLTLNEAINTELASTHEFII